MDAPFLFDDLPPPAPTVESDAEFSVTPGYPFATDAERIACEIMGTLDCLIPDTVTDARYDAAQERVKQIIIRELTHDTEDC